MDPISHARETGLGSIFGSLRLRSRAWWIAGAYALVATLWIYYSDRALNALIEDPDRLLRVSVYKGLGFVTVTTLMLFLMIRAAFGRIENGYAALKIHQIEIDRLKRLYASLSQINQAIVWTSNREDLFDRICETLTRDGGFRMVWIGWPDSETSQLVPVAEAGDVNGYLKRIGIYSEDHPEEHDSSFIGFREGRSHICNDLIRESSSQSWRSEVIHRGVRASASFPIRMNEEVCGTLNVYSGTPDFFQDKEIELLEEAAVDISFALDNLAREEDRRQARALAEREKRFSDTMIESMPGVLYFYDKNGRFLRWNRNFETVSGYTGSEIAKMHPLDFFAHEDRLTLKERIAEVFEKGESAVEAPFVSKDGTTTPYYFTGKQVFYDDTGCLVGVGIDVSDRKEAELALQKSELRYRSTLDNILEACQIIDFEWRYLYLNRAAAQQNRRPNEELLGRRMQEVWPGIENSDIYQWMLRCLEKRESFHEETEFVFPDGSSGWFDLRIEPVPEGIFLLSIEITERHHAECALRELNENLEQKIGDRTTELQNALVRAESADRLKSAFLATMSHELRTPLNSIIGFTGIVLQELPGPLNPEQRKQLGMVRASARHLLDLINDVLDLSKIEAGQLDILPETFDLAPVIERVVATLKPQASNREVKVTAELSGGHLTMRSDRRRVEQILLNLLNNAIKFTDEGTVTLSAGLLPPENGIPFDGPAVQIVIQDTGIGIRKEDLASLFQPFHQIDNGLTRRHDGTGLGLAICRRLIDLLGGEITVTSEWRQGSTFTVRLPLTHPEAT